MNFLLAPLALIFKWLAELRVYLYKNGFLKSHKLNVPVISVGNVTVGGTGKTPFIDVLVSQLEAQGLKVGLLSRGYGRKSKALLKVEVSSRVADMGDESLWLKQRHPQLQIAVGADRLKASTLLNNVNIIILDDGMQHLKIKRDLEITLLDCTRDGDHYYLLPQGRAREPLSALTRSDFVILSKINLATDEQVDHLADSIFEFGILDIIESETVFDSCEISLKGKNVYLCSGIANPHSFETIVKSQGAAILGHEILPDHSEITPSMIENLIKKAEGCDGILITEKDAVKWGANKDKVYVVKTKMTFNPELPSFYELVSHPLS